MSPINLDEKQFDDQINLVDTPEDDDSIDRELDENIKQIALVKDNAVIESRLAGWMAGENRGHTNMARCSN